MCIENSNCTRGSIILPLVLILIFVSACCHSPKGSETSKEAVYADSNKIKIMDRKIKKHAIVYKTRKDYSNYVPVILSDDKSMIVSYPSNKDVFYDGKLALPTKLKSGYLLDNRGISVNSAFLDMTYLEYSELPDSPSPVELNKRILDKDPFVEIWLCGERDELKDPVKELNELIDDGLAGCKRIK
jgi:hypothetical protein